MGDSDAGVARGEQSGEHSKGGHAGRVTHHEGGGKRGREAEEGMGKYEEVVVTEL